MLRVIIILLSLPIFFCSADNRKTAIAGKVKVASFNVSFAHDGDPSENFEQWIRFMQVNKSHQTSLIQAWKMGHQSDKDRRLTERIMQIRNVAAIIQAVRPDVLLLNEFNNDGSGQNLLALQGFQTNYLSNAQSINSVDGGDLLAPIEYPYAQSYASNTGLPSEMDLANDGYRKGDPNDAYGFGF